MKESEKIIRENCFKSRKDEEAVVCISDALEAIELARKEERQTDICNGLNSLMKTFKIPLTVDLNTEECRSMLNVVTKKSADCEMIAKAIKINEE